MDDSHLTPTDLASRWQCSRGWLANMRCRREGPPFLKFGGRVLYRLEDVTEWEASRLVKAA